MRYFNDLRYHTEPVYTEALLHPTYMNGSVACKILEAVAATTIVHWVPSV